jgi:hypothetical protein
MGRQYAEGKAWQSRAAQIRADTAHIYVTFPVFRKSFGSGSRLRRPEPNSDCGLALAASEHYMTASPAFTRIMRAPIGSNSRNDQGHGLLQIGDGRASNGGGPVTGVRQDGTRRRLADALRANLRRRKEQQREQQRHEAARASETATVETGPPEAMTSRPLPPSE